MMKWVVALSGLVWLSVVHSALAASPTPEEIEEGLDAILAQVVDDGWVDYAKLQADPAPLDAWLRQVEVVPSIELKKWSHDQAVAFFINAYNGNVLRVVRDHFPIEGTRTDMPTSSIQQIDGVWQLPIRVAGRDLSLDAIEKDVLIGEYDAPRVHMALVCGAVGCPKLRSTAYHGRTLLRELNLSAQDFIRSPRGARLDTSAKVLSLSQIFAWYEDDFLKFGTTVPLLAEVFGDRAAMIYFAASFLLEDERKFVREADFRVEFFEYDWTLNDISNR